MPPELLVFLAAATPVIELNAAIPFGLMAGLSSTATIFWAILGNTLITAILLKVIKHLLKFIFHHIPFLDRKIQKRLHKFNLKYKNHINNLGPVFLTIFIIVPIPASGSYSSVLLADLFELKFWPSLIAITIGNIIYALLITGGFEVFVKMFGIA